MNGQTDVPIPVEAQVVLNVMEETGTAYELRIFDASAHRASQAAALLGCPLGAVVKSLIFQTELAGEMLLVLVSGENRADPHLLSQFFKQPVHPADPQTVLEWSGYPVGAVPPFGMEGDFPVVVDADLMNYPQVWAAAGSAHVLFGISPSDLVHLSGDQIMELKLI